MVQIAKKCLLATSVAVWASVISFVGADEPEAVADPDLIDVHYRTEFDDDALPGWSVVTQGESLRRKDPPEVHEEQLYLLPSWSNSHSSATLDAQSDRLYRNIRIKFDLIMNTGTEGMGVVWLNADQHGKSGAVIELKAWEAPNLAGSFGIGLDASNPVNRDPFRGSGNVYDRPQHEVSLHFDGMELVKRVSEIDFRDEETHTIQVDIAFVSGGAEVTIAIDDSTVYDRHFIAAMTPYVGRLAVGARNSEIAGDVLLDNLDVECNHEIEAPAPPQHIVAIYRKINDVSHPNNQATVEFPNESEKYARVICTLALDKPESGFDKWDRTAHLFLYDEDETKGPNSDDTKSDGNKSDDMHPSVAGHRFELLRYITAYDRGHTWKVDVTDFLPLLRGTKTIEQVCGTQGAGWVVSVSFDFYEGLPDRVPFRVINLWSGSPEIGNPEKPVTEFYTPHSIPLSDDVAGAKIRTVVTGHGMSPNSDNAAEFMPISRTLSVNGKSFTNKLWKTDNYLNPCRPQGGTWKYDRAGWAPGDVVRPWEVDVSDLIKGSKHLTIEYELDEYVNENRGQSWAPTHLTEAQLILYRQPGER